MTSFSNLQLDCNDMVSMGISPILPLLEIPDISQIMKYYSKNPTNKLNTWELTINQIICECRSLCVDINCNTEFDILFCHNSIEEYTTTKAILNYVSVNRDYEIDYLPNGYSGICIIDFPNGKPDLLNRLKSGGIDTDNNNERLYLTNYRIYDIIRDKLK